MKKTLLLLASAALLLAGCAKEQFAGQTEGGLQEVTFTANLGNGVATKADADNDGDGTNVNRCIMEIYFQNQLYKRMEAAMSGTPATATFSNVPVVAGKQYEILFWADNVDVVNTEEGLATDKYYTTKTEENNVGLKAVAIKKTAFLAALVAGDNDKLDAFYGAKKYTVPQAGGSFSITLHRPFAQMNVITTDVASGKTVISADLLPETVTVSYTAATTFNVADSTATGSAAYTYTAPVYGDKTNWSAVKTRGEFTLSMDYILADKEQRLVNVAFSTSTGMSHDLNNLPYQRNYRTNIKGVLLTTQGQWTVTVDPIWELDPDGNFDYAYTSVYDIQGANDFVAQNQDKKEISVTFSTQPNDAGDPSQGTPDHPINAIVTSLLKQGATYNIDVASTTDVLYVGDYDYDTTPAGTTYYYNHVLEETSEKTNAAAVNLVVTDNLYIGTLVVNSPSKSVSINGQTVQSGKTYHIANLQVQEVSMNTVIIESGMVVDNLEMIKGGLEIHGTVHKATVPEGTPIADIKVRDCENLDEEHVYNVLKEYIADGYVGVKGRTTVGKWDIIPWVCKIGNTGYGSLADAVAAVQEGETITLVKDVENAVGIAINTGKTFTIDFNNHKYTVNKPGAGSTGTQTAAFQLIKGQTITFKNGTIKAAEDNLTEAVTPAKNIKRMFQSYANVTFEDMTIDGTNIYGNNSVCEFACGAVDIKGTTSITTGKQGVAVINVDTWKGAYPEGAQVTISSTGEFGDIYLYAEGTAAQYTKSSLAITDGKISKVYGDDSGDWTATISGGVFSEKPDDSFAPRGSAFVANTDAATKSKYPWKVGPKSLPGSGTVDDPYQIASAEDLCSMASYSPYTNFILTSDITTSAQDYTKTGTYFGKGIMQQLSGIFDGNGHTITFPEGEDSFYICSVLYKGTIKNLNVVFPEEGSLVEISFNNSKFENVNVGGKLLHFNGNCAAYVTYAYYDVTFENCTCSADITGVGGLNDYNAVFVGYSVSSPGPFVFKNCKYTGEMVTGRSAMFLGNPNSGTINMTVENCSNEGTIISTYVASDYKMNYYYAVSGNNYTAFNINGISHPGTASDQSWVPTCQEDNLVATTGKAINGPIDSGMAITKNGDNQFVVTPATGGAIGGKTVAKYTVFSGLYVGVASGSSRFFATEDITPDGSASYTTTMKDYKFVDHTYVNGGTITKVGNNDTYTDASGTYYVVDEDEHTGGHQPEAATIHYVAAYDAQGRLLASVNLE